MASLHHQRGNITGTRSGRGHLRNFIDWGSVHTGTAIEQEDNGRAGCVVISRRLQAEMTEVTKCATGKPKGLAYASNSKIFSHL
jgi:hypothetical protein